MFSNPKRYEIDHRTSKLLIGLIAISLPFLTSLYATESLQSISAAYHEDGWSRDIFVGFLFAISAFLLAYNGKSIYEMVLSKMAAIAAMGVAMFPTETDRKGEILTNIHAISAAAMFVILAIFCYIFFQRAYAKGHRQAMWRAKIYAICGITLVASISIMAIDLFLEFKISDRIPRLIFYGESAGLISFGVAWLCASRVLPFISSKDERFSPFRDLESKRSVAAQEELVQ